MLTGNEKGAFHNSVFATETFLRLLELTERISCSVYITPQCLFFKPKTQNMTCTTLSAELSVH